MSFLIYLYPVTYTNLSSPPLRALSPPPFFSLMSPILNYSLTINPQGNARER